MNKPLLSILSITYNHEKYIAQAIESWLMQKTDFDIEIVIGEDCSTDNTREIIESYWEKHPKLFRVITSDTNVGMMPNFIRTLEACKGKYIALCEGDDYWTDPYKLQKQVDFLEGNEEFVICFHQVKVLRNNFIIEDFITKDVPEVTVFDDLIDGNYIHTPSVVFRNILTDVTLPKNFVNTPLGDFYLYLIISQHGKIKKIREEMAVYRFGVGLWSSNNNEEDKALKLVKTYRLAGEGLNNLKLIEKFYLVLINYSKRGLIVDRFVSNELEGEILNSYKPQGLAINISFKTLILALAIKIKRKLWIK